MVHNRRIELTNTMVNGDFVPDEYTICFIVPIDLFVSLPSTHKIIISMTRVSIDRFLTDGKTISKSSAKMFRCFYC